MPGFYPIHHPQQARGQGTADEVTLAIHRRRQLGIKPPQAAASGDARLASTSSD